MHCQGTGLFQRAQSGILKFFKLPESVNPKKVDEETKTKIKGDFLFVLVFELHCWFSV